MTVVVTEYFQKQEIYFKDSDFIIDVKRSRGNGGQNVQKTNSAVVMTHKETGLKISMQDERSQQDNKRKARKILEEKVRDYFNDIECVRDRQIKKDLAGSGQRGDKIRTYRYQDDIVINHHNGNKYSLHMIMNGELNILF